MDQALFESLTGRFSDRTPVDAVPRKQRYVRSIMDHLQRLFNTREGSVAHLPEYGLPDISEVHRRMPGGEQVLRRAVVATVSRYEPRLKNVRVVPREGEQNIGRISYILTGEMAGGGQVRFQTTFSTTGHSTISPWKRPQ